MKSYFTLILFFSLFSTSLYAQPEGDTFPDFTVTDIEGNTHNLQSYLDDGKIVLIDVFATWCSICTSSLVAVDALYEDYGPDGDNTLVVLAFEKDPNTNNEAQYVETHNVPNPVIADGLDEIAEWNTIYQPNFFVVCSDGSFDYHFSGVGSSTTVLQGLIDDCESLSTGIEDHQDELGFKFLSNPVQDKLVFQIEKEVNINYSVLDMSGKVIMKGITQNSRNTVDVSSLDRGIYLLQLNNGIDTRVTQKFIKN